ncbi:MULTISPECIES: thymidylate kinase [unclassified Streptomyces]|uniref:thymidylate kinase n=1 Tax=unclassified Streptomyces TaxID=2593676 RepID=UPI00344E9C74
MGSDGAGKSTASRLVTERLLAAGTEIERVDRWDIVDNPAYPTTRFMKPGVHSTRLCVAEMPSASRFLFLMWSVSHALLGRTPAAVRPDSVTLLDGYWMKHAASEIVYGLDRAWVEGVVSGLPPCEQVIYLRIDPKQAWERKAGRDIVPYECGMEPECSQTAFLLHQNRILDVLDDWSERFAWLTVDAGQPLGEVVGQVVSAVSGTLAQGERNTTANKR